MILFLSNASPEIVHDFIEAQKLYREGKWFEALAAFKEILNKEPNFTLALDGFYSTQALLN